MTHFPGAVNQRSGRTSQKDAECFLSGLCDRSVYFPGPTDPDGTQVLINGQSWVLDPESGRQVLTKTAAPWTPESVTSNVPPVWGLMKSVSHSLFHLCRLINNVCLHNKTLSSQDCAFSYVHLTLLSIFSRAIRQILPVWVPKHIISWEDNGSPAFSTLCINFDFKHKRASDT